MVDKVLPQENLTLLSVQGCVRIQHLWLSGKKSLSISEPMKTCFMRTLIERNVWNENIK